jgi:hypothetical protein
LDGVIRDGGGGVAPFDVCRVMDIARSAAARFFAPGASGISGAPVL